MTTAVQLDLLDPIPAQEFEAWKQEPGAKQVLRHCYAITARFAPEAIRTGIPVSMKLVWELVRHHIKHGRFRMKRRGIRLEKWAGYTLNNDLTASIARHIMARRPQWDGIFETRHEWGSEKRNRRTRVIVVPANASGQLRLAGKENDA